MKSENSIWFLYNVAICFAVYWLSNLILWYPWSINERLGQILMLTINPLLWGFASYRCIVRCSTSGLIHGVILNSIIFTTAAIASDFLFFVVIRHAMDKLMHVTTFYAWGFVACLPFIIYLFFGKRMVQNRKQLTRSDFRKPIFIGTISFVVINIILMFHIKFG